MESNRDRRSCSSLMQQPALVLVAQNKRPSTAGQRQDHVLRPNLEVKVNLIHKTTANESGTYFSTKLFQVGPESNNWYSNEESAWSQKCNGVKRKVNNLDSSSPEKKLKTSNDNSKVKANYSLRRGSDNNLYEIKTERADGFNHIREKIMKIPFQDKNRHDVSISGLKYTEPVPLRRTVKTVSNNIEIVDHPETRILVYPEQKMSALKHSGVIVSKESYVAAKPASTTAATNILHNTSVSTQFIGKDVESVDGILAAGENSIHLTDCNNNFQRTQMQFLPMTASLKGVNKSVTSEPNSQTEDMEVQEWQKLSCKSTGMDVVDKPTESETVGLNGKIVTDKSCQNGRRSPENQLKDVIIFSDILSEDETFKDCDTEQNTDTYMSKSVAQLDVNAPLQDVSKSQLSDFDVSPSLPLDENLLNTCLKDVLETGQQDVDDLLRIEAVLSPKLSDFIQNKTHMEKENVSRCDSFSHLDLQEPDLNISPLLTYEDELYLKNSIEDVDINTDLWKNYLQSLGESNMKLPLDTCLLSQSEKTYKPENINYYQEKINKSIGNPRTYQYGKNFQMIKAMSKSWVSVESIEKLSQSEEEQSCEHFEKIQLLKKNSEKSHSGVSISAIKSVHKIVQKSSVKKLGPKRKTGLERTTQYDVSRNRNIHKIGEKCLENLNKTKRTNKKFQHLHKPKAKSDRRKDLVISLSNMKEGSFSNFVDHEKSLDLLDTGYVKNKENYQINDTFKDCDTEQNTDTYMSKSVAQLDVNAPLQDVSKSQLSDFDVSPSLPLDENLLNTCLKDVLETGQQDVDDLLRIEAVLSPKLSDFFGDRHSETQTIQIFDQDSAQITSSMLEQKPQRKQDTKSCSGRINKSKAKMAKFNRIVEVFCSQSKLMQKKSKSGQKLIQTTNDHLYACDINKDCERKKQMYRKLQNEKHVQSKVSIGKMLTPITVKPGKCTVEESKACETSIRNIFNEMKRLMLADNNLNVNMNSHEMNGQNLCSKSRYHDGSSFKNKKIFTRKGEIVKTIKVAEDKKYVVEMRTLEVHLTDVMTRPQFALSCKNNTGKKENPSRSSKLKDKKTKFKSEEMKRREKSLSVKASNDTSDITFETCKANKAEREIILSAKVDKILVKKLNSSRTKASLNDSKAVNNDTAVTSQKFITCNLCSHQLEHNVNMTQHIAKHHPNFCAICSKVFPNKLVSLEQYAKYLSRSLTTAESQADNSFHCKTMDCVGWYNFFVCPMCTKENCLTCKAIHTGMNCRQYQDDLKARSSNDQAANQITQMVIHKMLDDGEAMSCPKCKVILMKKEGCDWIQCSICKTEICWVTKQA